MKDRIATKPDRYAVYDDAHNFVRYEYHERADEPTEVGTPLNKANLLSDNTANIYGLTGVNATVDKALALAKEISHLKATNGWMKVGEVIIQWGAYLIDPYGTNQQNFPISFPSQCSSVAIMPSNGGTRVTHFKAKTTTYFQVRTSTTEELTGFFIAIGD